MFLGQVWRNNFMDVQLQIKVNQLIQMLAGEKKHVLFLVESGSRAYGLDGPDSDYDIRGVFVHTKLMNYFCEGKNDTVTQMWLKSDTDFDTKLDIVLYDILKFKTLLCKSNAQVVDWLMSPIWYTGTRYPEFSIFAEQQSDLIALCRHYVALAEKDIHTQERPMQHVFRGIINALFIVICKQVPPTNVWSAVEVLKKTKYHKIISKLTELAYEHDWIEFFDNGHELFENIIESTDTIQLDRTTNKHISKLCEFVTQLIKVYAI